MDVNPSKLTTANVREAVSDMTDTAKQQASQAVDTAQHAAMETIGDLEARIRKNPTQAALIAGGIGLALGLLLSR